MSQFLQSTSLNSSSMLGLKLRLIFWNLTLMVSRKTAWIMRSLSTSSMWMILPIAILSATRTDCYHERKSMIWWPGLGNINRGFHLRNLRFRTDFCCRYYGIFTQRELADYNYDYDYMCFPVCLFQKKFFCHNKII